MARQKGQECQHESHRKHGQERMDHRGHRRDRHVHPFFAEKKVEKKHQPIGGEIPQNRGQNARQDGVGEDTAQDGGGERPEDITGQHQDQGKAEINRDGGVERAKGADFTAEIEDHQGRRQGKKEQDQKGGAAGQIVEQGRAGQENKNHADKKGAENRAFIHLLEMVSYQRSDFRQQPSRQLLGDCPPDALP